MGATQRGRVGPGLSSSSVSLTGVFADLRAVARLIQLRARELGTDEAEEIGYLAQRVQTHAEQGLQRIATMNGNKTQPKPQPGRRGH